MDRSASSSPNLVEGEGHKAALLPPRYPIEVQTPTKKERDAQILQMEKEFMSTRKLIIAGLPPESREEV